MQGNGTNRQYTSYERHGRHEFPQTIIYVQRRDDDKCTSTAWISSHNKQYYHMYVVPSRLYIPYGIKTIYH